MKLKYMIIGAAAGLLSLAGCNKGGFMGPDRSMYDVTETMTLSVSAESVELDAEAPDEIALSFTWTPAREMPDDYIVTYVTMLDIEGNNFSNCVREVEDDGIYIKEYTNQQLQNYLVDKWGKNYSRAVTMEFKVIAKWEGGEKYIMPEVRTISVSVRPFRPLVFEADRVFISGDAVTGTTKQSIGKTPENEFVYAEEVWLQQGMMTIPIEYGGVTTYICPAEGTVDVPDNDQMDGKPAGTEYKAVVKEEPEEGELLPYWNIPAEGYWRVIIDMENKSVKFFSPKNRLEPLTVEFYINGGEGEGTLRKTINSLMHYGDENWSGGALNFMQSKTDPQLFIYRGSVTWRRFNFKSGNKLSDFEVVSEGTFNLSTLNASNVYTICPLQENIISINGGKDTAAPVTLGEWIPVTGGSSWHRGSYFQYVSGENEDGTPHFTSGKYTSITLDLRNMRMKLD